MSDYDTIGELLYFLQDLMLLETNYYNEITKYEENRNVDYGDLVVSQIQGDDLIDSYLVHTIPNIQIRSSTFNQYYARHNEALVALSNMRVNLYTDIDKRKLDLLHPSIDNNKLEFKLNKTVNDDQSEMKMSKRLKYYNIITENGKMTGGVSSNSIENIYNSEISLFNSYSDTYLLELTRSVGEVSRLYLNQDRGKEINYSEINRLLLLYVVSTKRTPYDLNLSNFKSAVSEDLLNLLNNNDNETDVSKTFLPQFSFLIDNELDDNELNMLEDTIVEYNMVNSDNASLFLFKNILLEQSILSRSTSKPTINLTKLKTNLEVKITAFLKSHLPQSREIDNAINLINNNDNTGYVSLISLIRSLPREETTDANFDKMIYYLNVSRGIRRYRFWKNKINYSNSVESKQTITLLEKLDNQSLEKDSLLLERWDLLYQRKKNYQEIVSLQIADIYNGIQLINRKFYRYMSFGLIEYYYDIVNDIVEKANSNSNDNIIKQLNVEQYIPLVRIRNYFYWILNTWVPSHPGLLDSKIIIPELSNPNGILIFLEFNNLRYTLDQYQAAFLPPVAIHLRINDFGEHGPPIFTNNRNTLLIDNKTPVNFNRIYNTQQYPDPSIIANYMSIAPNLLEGKGTMIMTYGYSGVGKTATLFGVNGKSGMLQAVLDQLPADSIIYFRAFELYGHGCQYDFYWNDLSRNISEILIHHNLDVKNGNLTPVSTSIKTERKDCYSYMLESFHPDTTSYIKLDSAQYRNFDSFIDKLDRVRRVNGIKSELYGDKMTQIKGTVNNSSSSRSIVVYDFQIKRDTFVPFVIYDLPGKEELYQTYIVNENVPTIRQQYAFSPVEEPRIPFNQNSRYVTSVIEDGREKNVELLFYNRPMPSIHPIATSIILNPLYIPYVAPIDKVVEVILTLDNILNKNYLDTIVNKMLNYQVSGLSADFTSTTPLSSNISYSDNGVTKVNAVSRGTVVKEVRNSINDLFNYPVDLKYIFNKDNFLTSYKNGDSLPQIKQNLYKNLGYLDAAGILSNTPRSIKQFQDIISQRMAMILIKILIEERMFDALVHIINAITGWEIERIYLIFEAYYINENVMGILNYMVKELLNNESPFASQNKTPIDTIMNNISKTAGYYSYVNTLAESSKYTEPTYIKSNLYLGDDAITSDDKNKQEEIDKLMTVSGIGKDGSYTNFLDSLSNNIISTLTAIDLSNRSDYNSNKIFRDSSESVQKINGTSIRGVTNRPFLYDYLEPYKSRIKNNYVFYVMTNNDQPTKAKEQIDLLNNSMVFINSLTNTYFPTVPISDQVIQTENVNQVNTINDQIQPSITNNQIQSVITNNQSIPTNLTKQFNIVQPMYNVTDADFN